MDLRVDLPLALQKVECPPASAAPSFAFPPAAKLWFIYFIIVETFNAITRRQIDHRERRGRGHHSNLPLSSQAGGRRNDPPVNRFLGLDRR